MDWGALDESLKCNDMVECSWATKHTSGCCRSGTSICAAWHFPLRADAKLAQSYEGCDKFCIVRHPVDRMLSEYKWAHRAYPAKCNISDFKQWAENSLRPGQNPYRGDCHFVPQVEYVFSAN